MSVAEINPFHMKMLTFTLGCYITHESLRKVGRGSARGPGRPLQRVRDFFGQLWTKKFYPTPPRFEILCGGISSWQILSSFFQILKRKQNEKEKLKSHFKEWERFCLAVISLPLPWWPIFTTGFNQQAPGDSSVPKWLHFKKDNLSVHARKCPWF